MQKRSDAQTYMISVSTEWINEFIEALEFYVGALREPLRQKQSDGALIQLIGKNGIDNLPESQAILEANRVINWLISVRDLEDGAGLLPISHARVRYLRSVGSYYVERNREKLNELGGRYQLGRSSIQDVSSRLDKFAARLDAGVFADAELVGIVLPEEARDLDPVCERVVASVNGTTPIAPVLDAELRERCLDLLLSFAKSNQHKRLDTVIAEATKVLEVRLRRATGANENKVGMDLANEAFAGDKPRIVLSTTKAERDAAVQLFRGIFGFLRNPVHHNFREIPPERAAQIIAFIDYLLYVIESAKAEGNSV